MPSGIAYKAGNIGLPSTYAGTGLPCDCTADAESKPVTPTAIALASFSATNAGASVAVRWQTTAEINTWGGDERQIQIVVDPVALQARDLTIAQLAEVLERNNGTVGGGTLESGGGG